MKIILQFKQSAVNFIKIAITLLIILNGVALSAQQDTAKEKALKNTLRFNITNPLIFGSGAIIFGYERQLRNNQSFSVNLGRTSYPKLIESEVNNPDLVLGRDSKDKGFNLSVDYRFYLRSENKYAAPRGVYIGPYYSYNYFNRVNDWTISIDDTPNSVKTDMTLGIHTVGVELGYQFVLWKRLSVDMILFGPGFASYSLKTKLSTTLDAAQEQKFFDALNTFLTEKIPGYDRVIDAGDFKHTGSASTTSFGYRYMVMIGYRF
jgi:hypothetical protein